MGTEENGVDVGIPDFQEQVAKAGEFLNELLSKRVGANDNKAENEIDAGMEIETIVGSVGDSENPDGNNSALPPDFSAMLGGLTRDLSRAINANHFAGINGGIPGQVHVDQAPYSHIDTGHAVTEVSAKDLIDNGSSLAALMAEDFPRDLANIEKPSDGSDKSNREEKQGFQCPICFKTLSSKNNLKPRINY